MKFAIDAFGGDNAPEAVIRGSIDAMQLNDDFSIIFTGDESAIYALLNNYEYDKSRVEVVHAPDIITCEDQPTLAVRRKRKAQLLRLFILLRTEKPIALSLREAPVLFLPVQRLSYTAFRVLSVPLSHPFFRRSKGR